MLESKTKHPKSDKLGKSHIVVGTAEIFCNHNPESLPSDTFWPYDLQGARQLSEIINTQGICMVSFYDVITGTEENK